MKLRRFATASAAVATLSTAALAAPSAHAMIPETSVGAASSEVGLPPVEQLPLLSAASSVMGSSLLWATLFPEHTCTGLIPTPCEDGTIQTGG